MVDRVKIVIKAGDGGDGLVHFRRAKFMPRGGPDGGDGGRGGSIYVVTEANLSTLSDFAHQQKFEAESGAAGGSEVRSGAAGADLVIKVPIGTLMKREGQITDFDQAGMRVLVAKGGRGGKGNFGFRSAVNQAPRESTPGGPGESFVAELELKLLADVGLVGLPNVGKSTLLSILTSARPKIADYPFTTLEPNLGVAPLSGAGKRVVIADIPGLIEGASQGKGLGTQFLQHIERTRVLVHVLAGSEPERLWEDYQTVRRELKAYGGEIENKKEIVVLNKTDLLTEEAVAEIVSFLAKKKIKVLPISCGTMKGIEELRRAFRKLF